MDPAITVAQKLQCAEREVKYRRRVYDRLVKQGKMKADAAELQISIMQAIADDYREFVNYHENEEARVQSDLVNRVQGLQVSTNRPETAPDKIDLLEA